MRAGSVFSGIGGGDLGMEAAGIETVFQIEIDGFGRSVLQEGFPGVEERFSDVREVGLDMWYDTAMKYQPPKKLTAEQIEESVVLYKNGASLSQIAAKFSVSRQSMWDLLRRRIPLRSQKKVGDENHFHRGGVLADKRAQHLVEKAIKSGDLVRPDICEACGGRGQPYKDKRHPIQAHHCDYNKPLDVMWLCKGCHHDWHVRFRAVPKGGEGGAAGSLPAVDILHGGFP